ncbi:MAG: hypothetical protein JOY91_14115 [Sinobacteraceae bacterium]|nr:hypothetical protein [Nevskiaceae bacterium]
MHEITLVLSDLYFPAMPAARSGHSHPTESAGSSAALALPGLSAAARFGRSQPCGDWRQWVARWVCETAGTANEPVLPQAPDRAPASIAARLLVPAQAQAAMVWFATPVHLLAGLSSVHLDRRGLLRLDAAEAQELAAQFAHTFVDSGFALSALPTGELLLSGPQLAANAREPARSVGADIAQALPHGPDSATLRRLGAEMEMWLHSLPANAARQQRGELPITSLWLWGGGALPRTDSDRPAMARELTAFGTDAWLHGLLGAAGEIHAVPRQLTDLFGYPLARRILLVTEIGAALRAHAQWGLREALVQIDHDFVAPAIAAMRRRELATLRILANDRLLELRARDRLRIWRRSRDGIAAFE